MKKSDKSILSALALVVLFAASFGLKVLWDFADN